ncbi:TadA family conjugal transfer-associated ATPase [Arcanobacterium ihumii]|uniref:TadA family conjugal transfer-associated ATPase n=1 Tax=Arcanobacterium ihumii TaxID=2138162 RepID=UPI00190F1555|nr:TadA family conjugal transfer-associated ATPase [Arcanobacterium ihumii]
MRYSNQQIHQIRSRLAAGTSMVHALEQVPIMFTEELAQLHSQVRYELVGAGRTLAPLLENPATTDVLVNGINGVWVDQGNGLEAVQVDDPQLQSDGGVRALAVRLAASCGQRLDDASPIVDGTFPSGIRLHAVLPPLSAQGTLISLRTHRSKVLTVSELVASGSIHPELEKYICAMVENRANIIISGATGAGKTTFLNAVLSLVPSDQRILIIEESAELAPMHPHIVHLQVRHANVQGVGEISMSELVRAAMRMRPDRIVLGECRGAEVRDVLSALNTGHEGGWATIHANSAQDVPARLVALGALAGMNEATVAAQASSALDAVIHVKREGRRRFVAQVSGMERIGGELVCVEALSVSADQKELWRGSGIAKLEARLGVSEVWG